MKRKYKIIIPILTLIVISIICIVIKFNKPKNFNVNIQIINKTHENINPDIDISIGMEETTTSQSIYSLNNIMFNSETTETINVDKIQGDFGITLKIEDDSTNSFYYTNGTNLSEVNVVLEIIDTSEGNIMVQGSVTSKSFFETKKFQKIKPITIKGATYE